MKIAIWDKPFYKEYTMKKQESIRNILICIAVSFLFITCDGPSPVISPGQPPGWVSAEFAGDRIIVEWDNPDDSDLYKVYRKDGNMDYIELAECTSPVFCDEHYREEDVMSYIVCCHYPGGGWTDPSPPSNNVSKYIQKVEASILQFDDRIEVTWDEQSQALSYNVYRYLSKADPNPVIFPDIMTTVFTDQYRENDPLSPGANKPYYYQVTWNQENYGSSVEYGQGGVYALGIYSTEVDYYEINNDWTDLEDQESCSVFSKDQPPITFCLDDGEKDDDWYKYYGPVENVFILINVPYDSQFTDQLRFQFYTDFNKEYGPVQMMYQGDNFFNFSFNDYANNPGEITDNSGNVSVYFRIFCETSLINIIDFYFIEFMQ
jgi:hypothetical protein